VANKALKGLTIKIGGDTSDLLDSLKDVEKKGSDLSKELNQINRLLKFDPKNTELLAQKQKVLAEAISNTEEKLGKLKDAEKEAQEQFKKGEITEEQYRALQREIVSTEQKLKKYEKEAEDVDKAQRGVADSAGKAGKEMDDAGDKSESTAGKFGKAEAAATALTAAVVALGKSSIEAFKEVDEGADNVIRATGATGAVAKDLTEVYKKVAGQVVGSFDEIGATVGEVNTRFGYTGDKLEQVSTDFMKFAEITGVNSTEAVKAVTRALNDSGIPLEEYGSLLDYLAKAGQSAGIDVTTLADSLSTNGATMRAMGLDTKETIALLAQFELSGADATTMLSGMKKAMAVWAEEGKNGNAEFAKTVEGIKNGSITAGDALDIFGKKAGPLLVDAIKTGKFEYQKMLDVIEASEGTLESTFSELEDGGYKTELTFQRLKLEAADLGETILEEVGPVFEDLVDDFKKTGTAEKFGKVIGKLAQTVLPPLAKVVGFVADNFETLSVTVGGAVTAFKVFQSVMAITTAISKASTAIKALSAGVGVATKMQHGWNAAMSANPIGAVISAVAWLTSSLLVLNSATEASADPVNLLTEEQKGLVESTQAAADAFRDQKKATEEALSEATGQMAYVTDLADELLTLADNSGKVKDADKARVDFILTELNEALGTEYNLTGNLIGNYKDLKNTIYEVIEAKKAQILLDAAESGFAESVTKEKAAYDEKIRLEEEYRKQVEATNKLKPEYDDWWERYNEGNWIVKLMMEYNMTAVNSYEQAKAKQDELKKSLDSATNTWKGHIETVNTYEEASAAALEGNNEKVIALLSSKSTAYKKYTSEVDEETAKSLGILQEDAERKAVLLEWTLEQYKKGVEGYDKKAVKSAEDAYKKAMGTWAAAYSDARGLGKDFGRGLADGISLKKGEVGAAAIASIREAVKAAKKEAEIKSPSRKARREIGAQWGEGVKLGVVDKIPDVKKASTELMAATFDARNTQDINAQQALISIGERQAERFAAGQMTAATANAGMLEEILGAIRQGQVLLLDGDTLVGGTANKMDNALGTIRALAARGAL